MPNGMDYSLKNRIIDGTGMILDTEPGTPDDVGTYVTENQLADWIKGKILFTGYYHNGNFYSDSGHTTLLAKVNGALYIDQTNANKALYVCLSSTYQSLTEEAQVQAILDGLDDGTIVPLKAKQDQNGNVIDQTYETKADASDLKDAIRGLQKQIDNITEAEDLLLTVDYKNGETAVPANVSEYAEVGILKGVGRVANNAVNPAYSSTSTINGITFTNNGDGSWTVSGATGDSSAAKQIVPYNMVASHSYLLAGARNSVLLAYIGQGNDRLDEGSGVVATITTDTYKALFIYVRANVTLSSPVTIRPISTDLNIYFGTSDLSFLGASDSAKLATIQQKYPQLLEPSDYGTSEVFPTYSAVKSQGVNLWDEEWELGGYNTNTGEKVEINTRIRSKTGFGVLPNTEYYFLFGTGSGNVFFYDWNGNYISRSYFSASNSFTTPSNCFIVKIAMADDYGTTYNHDIQFCLYSLPTEIRTVYHPYMTDTLTLPTPVTLKGAGSVSEMYYPESGRVTHPIGEHIVTGNETLNYGTWAENTISLIFPSAKPLARSNSKCFTSIYENVTAVVSGGLTYVRLVGATSRWANLDDFKTDAVGKTIYYELATTSADTYVDPIPDPFIQVEGGGTIKPVQTNEPEIDSAMTVTFTNKVTA